MTTSPAWRNGSSDGFSLLELLLAVAVLALLLAVSVPRAAPTFRRLALRDAARTLATNVRFAQAKSIAERVTVRMAFDPAAAAYRMEAAGPTGARPVFRGQSSSEFHLPPGARFGRIELLAQDGVTRADVLQFHPDGSGGTGAISVVGEERVYHIQVLAGAGRVSVSEARKDVQIGLHADNGR